MKKILIIAFHYPPVAESSGVQRSLKFSQYLLKYGWQSIVLTVTPSAYERINEQQLKDIPDEVYVERTPAFDITKQFSFFGWYPGLLALPDRWASWLFSGMWCGRALVKRFNPDVILSTYPIPTAHLLGYALHILSSRPWIADFRDSMTEDDYPAGWLKWRLYRWIERLAVNNSTRVVFTTLGTLRMYQERYPDIPEGRWCVIENGYDEDDFRAASDGRFDSAGQRQRLRLIHSGLLYPSERDPSQFFAALKQLKNEAVVSAANLQIILRASGNEAQYQQVLNELNIADIVELAPAVPYRDALHEMLGADGLLIFQAANCNHQVPAKVYEYFRAQRPVFAMTDAEGDTAAMLREVQGGMLVQLDSAEEISQGLAEFISLVRAGKVDVAAEDVVQRCSREGRTEALAALLDEVVS